MIFDMVGRAADNDLVRRLRARTRDRKCIISFSPALIGPKREGIPQYHEIDLIQRRVGVGESKPPRWSPGGRFHPLPDGLQKERVLPDGRARASRRDPGMTAWIHANHDRCRPGVPRAVKH